MGLSEVPKFDLCLEQFLVGLYLSSDETLDYQGSFSLGIGGLREKK